MFILNITCLVDDSSAKEFIDWLVNDFKSTIEKTSELESIKIIKVLDSPNEGQTFGIQLYANEEGSFTRFRNIHFPVLQRKMQVEYLGKLFLFDSLIEIIA